MAVRAAKRKKPTRRAPARTRALPAPDFAARLARLRERLATEGLRWALLTNPLDVAYFTGFLGGDSYLLVGPGKPVVISDFRYLEELEPVTAFARVFIRKGLLTAAVEEVLAEESVDRVAIQPEYVTLAAQAAMAKAAGESRSLVPISRLVHDLRVIKDDSEVALIRRAIQIQEAALLATLPTIRPGQTELDVAAKLESEMKSRGSVVPGFTSIIAARANGSLPHYRPGPATLAASKGLLIDWGATFRGYHGDMTRTFALGRWPAKLREIYGITLAAHRAAVAALAPGKTTREVDAAARDLIRDAGYGEHFGHGLGHGLGLQGHDEPMLSHMAPPVALRPGMVVTIEPGIYLPGVGGVRLEDDYLITSSGAENLCSLPLDLDWATL